MAKDAQPNLAVAHGRVVQLHGAEGEQSILQVRAPNGEIEITLEFTPAGTRVRLRASDLELEATSAIRVRCETFDVEAERGARIAAPKGAISLLANDDVDVKGERVLLNADPQPMPVSWEAFEAKCLQAPGSK